MRIEAVMPVGADLFADTAFSLEDVRALQDNPAYQTMMSRLRALAFDAAMDSDNHQFVRGVKQAIETIGYVEFQVQVAPEPEDAGDREPNADAILGFETNET